MTTRRTMQVRFFHNQVRDIEFDYAIRLEELQQQVNEWLAEQPQREIVEIKQSVGPSILISVWYMD